MLFLLTNITIQMSILFVFIFKLSPPPSLFYLHRFHTTPVLNPNIVFCFPTTFLQPSPSFTFYDLPNFSQQSTGLVRESVTGHVLPSRHVIYLPINSHNARPQNMLIPHKETILMQRTNQSAFILWRFVVIKVAYALFVSRDIQR